jgi:hypothetical protein
VEEGLASVAKSGEQIARPSLHHVNGELLLAQNPSNAADVELCFRTAIEIARGQSARMTELRVTTSLARLLAKRSKRDEARTILRLVYRSLRHRRPEGSQGAARRAQQLGPKRAREYALHM